MITERTLEPAAEEMEEDGLPKGGPKLKLGIVEATENKSFTDFTKFPLAKMYGEHTFEETPNGLKYTTTMKVEEKLKSTMFRQAQQEKTKRKNALRLKVAPKSSPLFQEFKIWQVRIILQFQNLETKEIFPIDLDFKQSIFDEVNIKGKLSAKDVLDIVGYSGKEWKTNFKDIEGNYTNENFYTAFLKIIASEGIEFPKEFKLTIDDEVKVIQIILLPKS
ncbi:hypothetical protein FQR65_LT19601 [Abscondita terminalis]|nr:hypothetical protein FQR65_LT19601 [Abscondita terminalis]